MFNRRSLCLFSDPLFPLNFHYILALKFIHVLNTLVEKRCRHSVIQLFLSTFTIFLSKEWIMPSSFSLTEKLYSENMFLIVWLCVSMGCISYLIAIVFLYLPTSLCLPECAGTSSTATAITKEPAFRDGSVIPTDLTPSNVVTQTLKNKKNV